MWISLPASFWLIQPNKGCPHGKFFRKINGEFFDSLSSGCEDRAAQKPILP